jgi:hypothetical protein
MGPFGIEGRATPPPPLHHPHFFYSWLLFEFLMMKYTLVIHFFLCCAHRVLPPPSPSTWWYRARICKRLRIPGIDSQGIDSASYAAWRAGTSNRVVVLTESIRSLTIKNSGSGLSLTCRIHVSILYIHDIYYVAGITGLYCRTLSAYSYFLTLYAIVYSIPVFIHCFLTINMCFLSWKGRMKIFLEHVGCVSVSVSVCRKHAVLRCCMSAACRQSVLLSTVARPRQDFSGNQTK